MNSAPLRQINAAPGKVSGREKIASKPVAVFFLDPTTAGDIYAPDVVEELGRLADVRTDFVPGANWRNHRSDLAEAEVIFSGWGAPLLDQEFLEAAPKLRAVFYGSGSIKTLVTEEFWRRDVAICCAAAANAIAVAEYTLSQILFLLKDGYRFANEVRRTRSWVQHWRVPGALGSKVGLLSLGSIGALVARKLREVDVEVLTYDPFATPAYVEELGLTPVSLSELFREADVVSIHTPLLPETVGLVNEELLRSMKNGGNIINTARGAIIDQEALTRVLIDRPDLFAVLDVAWPQPPPPESPLYDLPNVVITPHIAGSMAGECRRMGEMMLEEFRAYLSGRPLRWRVTKEMLPRMA